MISPLRPAKAGHIVLPGSYVLLALTLFASACSNSNTPTTPSATTPATFVMTWPTLAFAATPVSTSAAAPIAVTLSNFGTAPVPVAGVSSNNAGEFPFKTTCSVGGSLAANSTCQVTVNFVPSTTGARTATLTINANSTTQTFDLTGTGVLGVKPQLTIDQTTGPPATIFTMTVTGATPSSTLTLNTNFTAPGTPTVVITTTGYATDVNGGSTIATSSYDVGNYDSWVVDVTTGTASNHVVHTVK